MIDAKFKVKENPKSRIYRFISYITLCILAFLSLFFFYMLFINATRSNSAIQQGFSFIPGGSFSVNLKNVLSNKNLPVLSGIFNSLYISTMTAICSVYFSTMTAYGLHVYDFKGRNKAFTFILMIMMIPTQVYALGFVRLMDGMGLRDTFWPLILPAISAPIVVFFMKQYMASNLSMEFIEAARVDGAGELYIFNRIILPILKPAMAVQGIFAFVSSWNNYFIPALIIDSSHKKTLPILIAQLRSADFLKFDLGQVYMLIAIAIIPIVIMYICLSKFIVRGVAIGGIKG